MYSIISVNTTPSYGMYRATIQNDETGQRYSGNFTDAQLYDQYRYFDSEEEKTAATADIITLILAQCEK